MAQSLVHSALLADLYELTMAAAYFENNLTANATFELFVRSLPPERSFLLAAGLEQALDYLQNLCFRDEEIAYLREQAVFAGIREGFFDYLRNFRFRGEVWAMPEGTPVFAEEPLLRVCAPIIEAQVVETFLISILTFQTMIASKAARVTSAAQGRRVFEFGSRRAHGPEAGVLAARAAYIGGCFGTSNLQAGKVFDIPVFGTMAHSFVMACADEEEAYRRFGELFPQHNVLLIDTYDTVTAIEKIVRAGLHPRGVRLDSGNLDSLSKEVRRRLDLAGLKDTQIFASGDLDEFRIRDLIANGTPIDGFGVGTVLATSKDAPALSGVYKLVDLESEQGMTYRAKLSVDKTTYPGAKQVFRFSDAGGTYHKDVVGLASESYPEASSLLRCVMRHGERAAPPPSMQKVQSYAADQLARLPFRYQRLDDPDSYAVSFSEPVKTLLANVRRQLQIGAV
ncbi:MAG TPA: nicotinate phosphoribosyltransferase [Candidatus Sulfotelmatobacter sp.]